MPEFSRILHLTDNTLVGSETFFVQCFSKKADWLPSVQPGQIILMRNLRVTTYQSQKRGVGYGDTHQWVGYDPDIGEQFVSNKDLKPSAIPNQHFPFVKPNRAEVERFVQLSDWWTALKEAENEGMVVLEYPQPKPSRKTICVRDIQTKVFFDCVVEVRHAVCLVLCADVFDRWWAVSPNLLRTTRCYT